MNRAPGHSQSGLPVGDAQAGTFFTRKIRKFVSFTLDVNPNHSSQPTAYGIG